MAIAVRTMGLLTETRFSLGKDEPNRVVVDSTFIPALSTSRWAPSRSRMRATAAPSSAVWPPFAPSVTLYLQITARSRPTASSTRRSTREGKRRRLSRLPPQSSRRWLYSGEMNWLSR
ncbi:hypothetical protein D3C81_1445710 [compost metagenome]